MLQPVKDNHNEVIQDKLPIQRRVTVFNDAESGHFEH